MTLSLKSLAVRGESQNRKAMTVFSMVPGQTFQVPTEFHHGLLGMTTVRIKSTKRLTQSWLPKASPCRPSVSLRLPV